jgi:hypothetical protein
MIAVIIVRKYPITAKRQAELRSKLVARGVRVG